MNIRTVTYNWKNGVNDKTQIGFIAQNLNEYFSELVNTNKDGMLSVNYAGMTPVLVKAIQELNIKVQDLESLSLSPTTIYNNEPDEHSLRSRLIAWFADMTNGIGDFFAGRVRTNQLCVADESGETCLNRSQIDGLLSGSSPVITPIEPTIDEPEVPVDPEPVIEQSVTEPVQDQGEDLSQVENPTIVEPEVPVDPVPVIGQPVTEPVQESTETILIQTGE
jgi:hypothetical protein